MTDDSLASEKAEQERLRALRDYGVLDSQPDPVFDDLTALAALICGAPISLVSLVDESRQWFKSNRGLCIRETSRTLSFCSHTIREADEVMIVENAANDPRFADNELVTGEPHIRYYAGATLRTPDGYALGTLCVIDRQPRKLSAEQLGALVALARQAMSQLELRRALNALRASEQRFSAVAKAVSDAIFDWDLVADKMWWSDGMEKILGYAGEDIPATGSAWGAHVHPEDRARVEEKLHRTLASEQTTWGDEYRFRRVDGRYLDIHDRGEIFRDAHGVAYRMVGGLTDLTERKQLELQSLRSQRMDSIGALAAGIAHDLNNVLAPILLSIDLLKGHLSHDHTGSSALDTLEHTAVRGADLVQQILTFARGVEGGRRPTDVTQVLSEAVRLAKETFPRSITFDAAWSTKEPLYVLGDPTHLHQVFMNLLVNARDAMPNGGILRVSARSGQLSDSECAAFKKPGGKYVMVAVQDSGVGIAPEIIDRIFEPFFTTKPQGAGTGFGLSTVHGIVASHNGFVRVSSMPGAGSTFTTCFPAASEPARSESRDGDAKQSAGQGELILLVDDEAAIRTIASLALQMNGYRVVTAENGVEALAVFDAHSRDITVAVIDHMMPVMDGPQCTLELLQRRPDLAIIGTSGVHRSMSNTTGGKRLFLQKPYTTPALLAAVRSAITSRVRPSAAEESTV